MDRYYIPPLWTIWINVVNAIAMFAQAVAYWYFGSLDWRQPLFVAVGLFAARMAYTNYKQRRKAMADIVRDVALNSGLSRSREQSA